MLNNIFFFVIGLCTSLIIFYPDVGIINNEELIIAIFTIILVLITGYYAFITSKILEIQKRPEINLSTYSAIKGSSVFSYAIIENVGKSTAYNIRLSVENSELVFAGNKKLKDLTFVRNKIESLNPGESRQFHIDEKSKITERSEVKFSLDYVDELNKSYSKYNFVYLTGLNDKIHPLSNIAPAVKGLSVDLSYIATTIERIDNSLNKK